MGSGLERCSAPACGELYASQMGRVCAGKTGRIFGSIALLNVHFYTTASWMEWGGYFKWYPTSCPHSSIFHLLLLLPHFALRSCRAGQWAAQTDGGLAHVLVQCYLWQKDHWICCSSYASVRTRAVAIPGCISDPAYEAPCNPVTWICGADNQSAIPSPHQIKLNKDS